MRKLVSLINMKIKSIAILLLFALPVFSQGEWKLSKSEGLAKGYIRATPNNRFKEYRITIPVKASLQACVALYCDFSYQGEWMENMQKSTKLKPISDTEWICRYQIDLPWPMQDRDIIYHVKLKQDPATKTVNIKLESEPKFFPVQSDYTRINISKGSWTFTPKGNGIVEAETYGFTDPEGVPAWIVNMYLIDVPLKTMMNFKREVESDKYKNAKLSFIQN